MFLFVVAVHRDSVCLFVWFFSFSFVVIISLIFWVFHEEMNKKNVYQWDSMRNISPNWIQKRVKSNNERIAKSGKIQFTALFSAVLCEIQSKNEWKIINLKWSENWQRYVKKKVAYIEKLPRKRLKFLIYLKIGQFIFFFK